MITRINPEAPMVLRGAKLHAELNREYYDGLREGSRYGFAFGVVAAVIVGGLGWLGFWLIERL